MDSSMDLDQTQAIEIDDIDDSFKDDHANRRKEPAAYLKVLAQRDLSEICYPLYEGDNIIGGHTGTCEVVIPCTSLSNEHACIQIIDDSHLIFDKNSRNKTRRGKLILQPEVRYELRDGDELTFADVKCIYEILKLPRSDSEDSTSEAQQTLLLSETASEEDTDHKHPRTIEAQTLVLSESDSEDDTENRSQRRMEAQTLVLDGSDDELPADFNEMATQAHAGADVGGMSHSTQAYTETAVSKGSVMPGKPTSGRHGALTSCRQLEGTHSFEVEDSCSLEGTAHLEEADTKRTCLNFSDVGGKLRQVVNDCDEVNEDAAGLFATSTLAYDVIDDGVDMDDNNDTNERSARDAEISTHHDKVDCSEIVSDSEATVAVEDNAKDQKTTQCSSSILATSEAIASTLALPETLNAETVVITSGKEKNDLRNDDVTTQKCDETLDLDKADSIKTVKCAIQAIEGRCQANKDCGDGATVPINNSISILRKPLRRRSEGFQLRAPREYSQVVDSSLIGSIQALFTGGKDSGKGHNTEKNEKTCWPRKQCMQYYNSVERDQLYQKSDGTAEESTQVISIVDNNATMPCSASQDSTLPVDETEDKESFIESENKGRTQAVSAEDFTQKYVMDAEDFTQKYVIDAEDSFQKTANETICMNRIINVPVMFHPDTCHDSNPEGNLNQGILDDRSQFSEPSSNKSSPLSVSTEQTVPHHMAVEGEATLAYDMAVEREATLAYDIAVEGEATLAHDIAVEGEATLAYDIAVEGEATLAHDIAVEGEATLAYDMAVEGEATLAYDMAVEKTPRRESSRRQLSETRGRSRNKSGDNKKPDNFPYPKEIAHGSQKSGADIKLRASPLASRSPLKSALVDRTRSPSPAQKHVVFAETVKYKGQNGQARCMESPSCISLVDSEVACNSTRLTRTGCSRLERTRSAIVGSTSSTTLAGDRRTVETPQLTEAKDVESYKSIEVSTTKTVPATENKTGPNMSELEESKICTVVKQEHKTDVGIQVTTLMSPQTVIIKRRKGHCPKDVCDLMTLDTIKTCSLRRTLMHKTGSKRRTPVDEPAVDPASKKIRKSVIKKVEEMDTPEARRGSARLKRKTFSPYVLGAGLKRTGRTVDQSKRKKETGTAESDETTSIISSVDNNDKKVDKKEQKDVLGVGLKQTGRTVDQSKIIKEMDTAEIDETTSIISSVDNNDKKVDKKEQNDGISAERTKPMKTRMVRRNSNKNEQKVTGDCRSDSVPSSVNFIGRQVSSLHVKDCEIVEKIATLGKSHSLGSIKQDTQRESSMGSITPGKTNSTANNHVNDGLQSEVNDISQGSEQVNSRRGKTKKLAASPGMSLKNNTFTDKFLTLDSKKPGRKGRKSEHLKCNVEYCGNSPDSQNSQNSSPVHTSASSTAVSTVRCLNSQGRSRSEVAGFLPTDSSIDKAEFSQSSMQLSNKKRKKKKRTDVSASEDCSQSGNNGRDKHKTQRSLSPAKRSRTQSSPSTSRRKFHKESVCSPALDTSSTTSLRPKIIFTGYMNKHAEKTIKELGGEMCTSIQECTHLVADRICRTVKLLCGLAKGLPIVSPEWLEKSKQAGAFLDGHKFLVSDPAMEKQFSFSLAASITKSQSRPLFTGYRIHVTKSIRPDPAQMKEILKCAGAQCLKAMPGKFQDNTVVISSRDDHSICQPAIKAGIPIADVEFILTGILRQEIDLEPFLLFRDRNSSEKQQDRHK